jgi:hypothetical protein
MWWTRRSERGRGTTESECCGERNVKRTSRTAHEQMQKPRSPAAVVSELPGPGPDVLDGMPFSISGLTPALGGRSLTGRATSRRQQELVIFLTSAAMASVHHEPSERC